MGKGRWNQKASFDNHFNCTRCGNQGIPLSRRNSRGREAGHLKKLWCLNCKKEVNHVEWKEFSHYDYIDFCAEFMGDNFTNEGDRKVPFKKFKQNINKKTKNRYEDYAEICAKIMEIKND